MAGSTTNLGLIKPLGTEKIRIAQINQNSDTLDTAIGAVGSTSLQAQVGAIEDGIAIVANGDSHVAITAGQFVYVRNNTHNLAEGLYVASANVSANASITSSNMTADASGGLNALNAKFPTKVDKTNMTDGESYTYTSQSEMESGLVSLATTVMGANKVRTIFLYPNFTSQMFGGAAGCATISTGGSSSYFTVLFHNYVTAVHGMYLNGTWSWEKIALNSEFEYKSATVCTGFYLHRIGNFVYATCLSGNAYSCDETNGNVKYDGTVISVPNGYRPVYGADTRDTLQNRRISVTTGGQVTCGEAFSSSAIRFAITWMTRDNYPA